MTSVHEEYVSVNYPSAYENVGFLSENIWMCNSDSDFYKKSNKELWKRFNETEQSFIFASCNVNDDDSYNTTSEYPQTVQNVIPNSRLVQYGDYTYDENREQFYTLDDMPAEYIPNYIFVKESELEVWMLQEVEEEFKRLTFVSSSRWCTSSPSLSFNDDFAPTSVKENESYNWLTSTPWPQVLLTRYTDLPSTLQASNKSLFSDSPEFDSSNSFSDFGDPVFLYQKPSRKKMPEYQFQRYTINTNEELRLYFMSTSPAIQQIWQRPDPSIKNISSVKPPILLNADVPEFQPTKKRNDFPPFYDFNYESDLFPYSESTITPNIMPPMSCNMSVSSDMGGHVIPVYQRPPEFYSRTENGPNQKKRTVGADINNLIFLTQDEGGNYSGLQPQSLESIQIIQTASLRLRDNFPQLPRHSGHARSSNKESCQEMLAQVNKWLDRVYPVRSNNFTDISSTSDKMENLATKVQNNYFPLKNPNQMNLLLNQPSTLPEKPVIKRRLYRDVLTSGGGGGGSNDIENKFEELEREALEQYAGSDTSLIATSTSVAYCNSEDNMVTRRYQDLEREAVEQYQGNGSNGLQCSINGREHFDSMDMIPVVKAPYPSPPSSIERDSCLSQSSGNSQIDGSPRRASDHISMSNEGNCSNINRTKVFAEPWAHMLSNYNQKPPAWMKRKKKKVEKKKKNTKQKKKANNSDSCKDTVDKICELLSVYFQLQNYLKLLFFNNPLVWNIKSSDLIKFGLTIVVGSVSEFKSLMLELYVKKERRYSKKKVYLCDRLINLTVDVTNLIARYFVAADCNPFIYQKSLDKNRIFSLECMNVADYKNRITSVLENLNDMLCSHIRKEFSNPIYPFETMMSINNGFNCACLIPHYRSHPGTDFIPVVLINSVKQISIVIGCKIFRSNQKNKKIFFRDFTKNSYLALSSKFVTKINNENVNKSFWMNTFSVDYLNSCLKYNLYLCLIKWYTHRFLISLEMSPKYSLIWNINTKNMICFANCGRYLGFWCKSRSRWMVDELYLGLYCCRHKTIGICSKCGKWDFFTENVMSHEKCSSLSLADYLIDPLFKAADREVKLRNPHPDLGSENIINNVGKIANSNKQFNNSSNQKLSENNVKPKKTSLIEDLKSLDKTCMLQ